MTVFVTRRTFLNTTAAGVGAAGLVSAFPWAKDAKAAIELTGVQWGGLWVDSAKAVTAKQDKFKIKWELHAGGSAAIIGKIKASWPNVKYDFVAQYNPLYYIWDREGWAEPMTVEEMPNLKDLAADQFHRNAKGEIISAPMSIGGNLWGYRKDLAPFAIENFDDLLDPRLEGKVVIGEAVIGLNRHGVAYALANGGDEHNLGPGWEFLKKLVQSGNVARVAKSDSDFITALTTGEAAVGFWNIASWGAIRKNFPVEFLIKDKATHPGFQIFTVSEGYMIPKVSPNKAAAKEYINWFLGPENNALYNKALNFAPTNVKAKGTELSKVISFQKQEDRDKYYYNMDFDHLSKIKDQMITRFEKEILPLIK